MSTKKDPKADAQAVRRAAATMAEGGEGQTPGRRKPRDDPRPPEPPSPYGEPTPDEVQQAGRIVQSCFDVLALATRIPEFAMPDEEWRPLMPGLGRQAALVIRKRLPAASTEPEVGLALYLVPKLKTVGFAMLARLQEAQRKVREEQLRRQGDPRFQRRPEGIAATGVIGSAINPGEVN